MNATRELLGRLAASDERSLGELVSPGLCADPTRCRAPVLDPETRILVELAALLAADATTTSLRWVVDRACGMGADDETIGHVLPATGWAAGAAQTITSARRPALALDVDLEADGGEVQQIAAIHRAARRPPRARPPRKDGKPSATVATTHHWSAPGFVDT
jgi:alkylhydroperoxidase/carboxymuconolactone decarboxylase family protein YurZ